jgi:hypothetical protein
MGKLIAYNVPQVWLVADLKRKIMIEKIDKIRDLLIVPSVDEQPKMAINQMKILNLLVELRAEAEQLTIPAVVGRSEQLVCDVCGSNDVIEAPHMGKNCNRCHPL